MRRISVYVLYGFAIFVLISAHDLWFTRQAWVAHYESTFGTKADRLNDEAYSARMIYQSMGGFDRLSNYLENRRRMTDIGFWIIYEGDQVLATSLLDEELPYLELNLDLTSREVASNPGNQYFYAVEDLDENHRVVVGLFNLINEFLKDKLSSNLSALGHYLIGVMMVCLATFVFFMRDIVNAIREISRRGTKSYKGLSANSKEAEMLARGIAAFDDKAKQLEKERNVMTEQVLSSLRTEIMSGRTPPYSFDCALVRTDINNFSTIYNNHPVEEFSDTINDFFTDATHIIARYGGYVHEFIGDEVIYYFKEEEVKNSTAVALSAIRDINAVADSYHRMTLKERGYPFTVKSSLAHGTLRFGRLVEGFGLSGPSLIETVRILSTVAEKDGCVAVFDERHGEHIEELATYAPYAEVKLKGFSETRRLLVYGAHHDVHYWLNAEKVSDLDNLTYYRSDKDLATILGWLKANWQKSSDRASRIIYGLRGFNVTESDGEVQSLLFSWLNEMLDESLNHKRSTDMKVLSSSVRLIENLVPRGESLDEIESILNRTMQVSERRVVANALDTLAVVKEAESKKVRALISHPDNRIAANALLREGMKDISSYVLRSLKHMMKSEEHVRVSSALYALGEIAEFHRKRDNVYYATQLGFQRLVRLIPDYAFHSDERVRRQAIVAAKKAGVPEILAAIEQRAHLAIHADYSHEILELLGSSSSSSHEQAA